MEFLIIILVVGILYLSLRFKFELCRKDSQDEEFDRIKAALDNVIDESPYKFEPKPKIAVKKRTRKKTDRDKTVKKVVPKKKVVKKKTKKKVKTKRKTK